MRKLFVAIFLSLCIAAIAQGNIERLDLDKGFGTVKIGMMVFPQDYETPAPAAVKSRYNEFSLLKENSMIGNFQLADVSVWAHDLIIERIKMLIKPKDKQAFLQYLIDKYGDPTKINDAFIWQTPEITLSFRDNPTKPAVKKKGQGLAVFWRTSDFERVMENIRNRQTVQM